MGAKGQAYRQRLGLRRDAEFKEVAGKIRAILYSPKLREAAEWVDAHPGKDPEFEKCVWKIIDALKRLRKNWEAAARRSERRRARFRVVK
jgi:hypothetical protein